MKGKLMADKELCQILMAKLNNLTFDVCVKGPSSRHKNKYVAEIEVTMDVNDLMQSVPSEVRQIIFRDGFDTKYISHELYNEMNFDPDQEVTQVIYQSFKKDYYFCRVIIRVTNWTISLRPWELEAKEKQKETVQEESDE